MPTSYTALIKGNPETTFQEFAWRCARAMEACVMQRDDPFDAPIKLDVLDDYYDQEIDRLRHEITDLDGLTGDDLAKRFRQFMAQEMKELIEQVNEVLELSTAYHRILKEVEDWSPPTEDHVQFKQFMAKQLRETIYQDCECTGEYLEARRLSLEELTPESWRKQKVSQCRRDMNNIIEDRKKECKRVQDRNLWKAVLAESLGVVFLVQSDAAT